MDEEPLVYGGWSSGLTVMIGGVTYVTAWGIMARRGNGAQRFAGLIAMRDYASSNRSDYHLCPHDHRTWEAALDCAGASLMDAAILGWETWKKNNRGKGK